MRDPLPTHEELEPHILQAVQQYGTGTFTDIDNTMKLTIDLAEPFHNVTRWIVNFNYKWVNYSFRFTKEQVEGISA